MCLCPLVVFFVCVVVVHIYSRIFPLSWSAKQRVRVLSSFKTVWKTGFTYLTRYKITIGAKGPVSWSVIHHMTNIFQHSRSTHLETLFAYVMKDCRILQTQPPVATIFRPLGPNDDRQRHLLAMTTFVCYNYDNNNNLQLNDIIWYLTITRSVLFPFSV